MYMKIEQMNKMTPIVVKSSFKWSANWSTNKYNKSLLDCNNIDKIVGDAHANITSTILEKKSGVAK